MTEIKIPFIKTKVEKYSGSDKPDNMEGLILEVSSTFRFNEIHEKVPLTGFLVKMELRFEDGAEKEIFDELLDKNKASFELSFEKEKVNFWVMGEEKYKEDDTKLVMNCSFSDNDKDKDIKDVKLQIEFEPKFAGVVKITYAGEKKDNDDKDNKTDQQKIDELEAKIKELEEKLQKKNNSEDQKKVKELKKDKVGLEVSSLQKKIKELEDKIKNTDNSTEKDNYQKDLETAKKDLEKKEKEKKKLDNKPENSQQPNNSLVPWLIGGGVLIIVLLIVIIILLVRPRRDK